MQKTTNRTNLANLFTNAADTIATTPILSRLNY